MMGGTVAGGLGGVGQRLDRAAVDEIHRQNVGRAELIVGHRQAEFVAPRQIGGIEAHLCGLAQIIGLGMQLAARLVHQGRQVDPLRHQAGMRSKRPILSMSLSMLSRTPGYWTLIARSRPSRVCARCTCPIEAAAIGLT